AIDSSADPCHFPRWDAQTNRCSEPVSGPHGHPSASQRTRGWPRLTTRAADPRMCGPGRSRSPMRSTALAAALLTLAGGGALTGVGAAAAGVPAYVLLSVNSRERAADDRTYEVDVSGSGRYV